MGDFNELSRVVMEANAFNKLVKKRNNDVNDIITKNGGVKNIKAMSNKDMKKVMKELKDSNDIMMPNKKQVQVNGSDYILTDNNDYVPAGKLYHPATKGSKRTTDSKSYDENNYKRIKNEWMANHGNVGKDPKDKYEANRYLNRKNVVSESVKLDELKLEIYESCMSGEITKDERDLLLNNLERR